MSPQNKSGMINRLLIVIGIALLPGLISSCNNKAGNASPLGTNVKYRVFNLSPDAQPVFLFIDNARVNSNPFIFGVDQGYFYVPSTDLPYQIRTALNTGVTLITRNDVVKSGYNYTLYITGTFTDKSDTSIFTVDTSAAPPLGRGKLRFVDVSPSATTGLDVYANGTLAFQKLPYLGVSKYIELPDGNYDIQLFTTGTSSVLKDLPQVTIQDGRLYTLYAYGYTSRADSAAFNAAIITNK